MKLKSNLNDNEREIKSEHIDKFLMCHVKHLENGNNYHNG